MRRVTMLLAAVAVMVSLFAAVAYAATIEGTSQGEVLQESSLNDTIYGRGGNDIVEARSFVDDKDVVYGNGGGDDLRVADGDTLDTANGGKGNDTCIGDQGDEFIGCETVINP